MRFFRKISKNREIEDITADEQLLYILICHIMMDIKKKGGGAYEPTTHASSASCFSHENLIQCTTLSLRHQVVLKTSGTVSSTWLV